MTTYKLQLSDVDQETSEEAMDAPDDSSLKTSKQVKKGSPTCHVCGKSFSIKSSKRDLKRHIKNVHGKIKDNACRFCDKLFGRKDMLKRHIKLVHDKINDQTCQFCGNSFGHRALLLRHIRRVHRYNQFQKGEKSSSKQVENMKNTEFGNKSSQEAKTKLDVKSKRQNDHEDENLMLTDENEGLKKENLSELKELFQKQDKRLEWFQQQNDKKFDELKELFQKQNDKKLDELKELFQKQNDKKLDELKELFQQQNDKKTEKLQREMEDLTKELISRAGSSTALLISQILNTKKYENEITHLKKEVIELQEKLHAKTATNGTNDNHSLDAEINPNDYQFNHECMVKEEVLGQNSDFQPDSVVKNEIIE